MWNWLGMTNETKVSVESEQNVSSENEQTAEQTSATEETKDKVDENEQGKPAAPAAKKESEGVEKKVTEVAANLSNYLYNFASAATKTATKLKDSVDEKLEKTIVGDFNRENEKFIQEKETRRIGDAVPPWVGFHEEKVMKSQILALSADERNFLRDPPSGVDFRFNIEQTMPTALAVLQEDKELEKMRFALVPKKIKEERFWRNYFYRVSLIKQSTQLSSLSLKDQKKSPRSGSAENVNKSSEKPEATKPNETPQTPQDDQIEDVAGSPMGNEFVSDAFDDNAHLSEEEKTQMLGLNDKPKKKGEEDGEDNVKNDWDLDKELQDELESFELVDDTTKDDDNEWQKEIEELLEEENK